MSFTRRVVSFSILASIAVGATSAQVKVQLNQSDPFTIDSGSTFSASGGSPNAGKTAEKLSKIAAEIREAQELITRNHIDGSNRPNDLIKTALDGMLRSLDPHSNFYDATEWRDLLDEQRSGYTGIGATIANFEEIGCDRNVCSRDVSRIARRSCQAEIWR